MASGNSRNIVWRWLHCVLSLTRGGEWLLEIIVPERYPYVPPDIKFKTPICHPNVHFEVVIPWNSLTIDWRNLSWRAQKPVESCMDDFHCLHCCESTPWITRARFAAQYWCWYNPYEAILMHIANLLRSGDHMGYDSLVKMYTYMYATPSAEAPWLHTYEALHKLLPHDNSHPGIQGMILPIIPRNDYTLYLSIHWKYPCGTFNMF